MPKSHRPYAPEFRRQMVDLVRSGRTPEALSREFEPTAQTIWSWVRQADRDEGRRRDGPTSAEREELTRLRRENRQLRQERDILAKAAAWFALMNWKTRMGSPRSRVRTRPCLCQDIALLAQSPVLTPQTGQLLALGAGRAVLSAAFIAIGLAHPIPDRLRGRFELARQRLRCSPRSHQINHLSSEFRCIGSVTLRH